MTIIDRFEAFDSEFEAAVQDDDWSRLEKYYTEDALDSLVCAWAGTEYLCGRCQPYGDDTAAIWIPTVHNDAD